MSDETKLQDQIAELQLMLEEEKQNVVNLQKQISELTDQLSSAEETIDDLTKKLNNTPKPGAVPTVEISGKEYNIVIPKFMMNSEDGGDDFETITVERIQNDEALAKKLLGMKHGALVEVKK